MSYYINGLKIKEKKENIFNILTKLKEASFVYIKKELKRQRAREILNQYLLTQIKDIQNKDIFTELDSIERCVYIFDANKDYLLINNTSIIDFTGTIDNLFPYEISTSTGMARSDNKDLTEEETYQLVLEDWELFTKGSFYINQNGIRFELFTQEEIEKERKLINNLNLNNDILLNELESEYYTKGLKSKIIKEKINKEIEKNNELSFYDLFDKYVDSKEIEFKLEKVKKTLKEKIQKMQE